VKEYIPLAANQLWVSDITYIVIWTDEDKYEFCFLSIILDAYTEEIVGYSVGATLKTTYPLKALEMALLRLNDGDGRHLIHHSDRGVQYASSDYIDLLKSREIQISMTEGGDPKDNAQAERINNTIKNELLKGYRFTDIEQVRQAVRAAVEFYNTERPHMSIDMRTPAEAYLCSGELVKRWKSYRLQAIKKQHEVLDIPTNVLPLPVCQGSPSGLRPPVNP
jgi:transposase InsO family protein